MNAVRISGLPDRPGDAARRYLDSFPAGDVVAFPITGIDRIGVPVWVVALFPTSPTLSGIMPYGVGYGTSDEAAILGGLGEIAEMVWPTLTLSERPRTRASHADLVASVGDAGVADPLTLCLPAGSPVARDTPLDWVEATRWADGSTVLVPIELAAYSANVLSPGYVPFTTLISNGMGAGPDLDWAVGHGLCELLQRDGNGLLFRAMDQGIVVDLPEAVPAEAAGLIERFAEAGIRAVPKFATDEFGIANLYAVGMDRRDPPTVPLMVTACGEAAHPDRDAALAKALAELAASRARKAFAHGPLALAERFAPEGYIPRFLTQAGVAARRGEARAFQEMRRWAHSDAETLAGWLADSQFAERGRRDFTTLPTAPAEAGRGARALEAVSAAGFDILYVDVSPPGAAVRVVRVIVPGLEVETMSYYRIGARNAAKLIARDSPLVTTAAGAGRRPIRLTEAAIEGLGGKPLFFDTVKADAIVGPLYPLYREPEAHHVAWADAKRGG